MNRTKHFRRSNALRFPLTYMDVKMKKLLAILVASMFAAGAAYANDVKKTETKTETKKTETKKTEAKGEKKAESKAESKKTETKTEAKK